MLLNLVNMQNSNHTISLPNSPKLCISFQKKETNFPMFF